jgi:hypothetical protein
MYLTCLFGISYLGAEAFGGQTSMDILNRLNSLSEFRHDRTSAFATADAPFQVSSPQSSASLINQLADSATFQPITDSSLMHSSFSDLMSRDRYEHEFPRRSRPRAYSLPSSPQNVPSFELEFEAESEEMHHSLPNVHLNTAGFNVKEESINEMEAMHHSLPNMTYATNTPNTRNMDPMLMSTYANTQLQQRLQREAFITRPSPQMAFKKPAPQSRMDEVSKDFLSCLEKLTESTIADDNPFEPIPITPKTAHKLSIGKADVPPPEVDDATAVLQEPMLLTPPNQVLSLDINREMFRQQNPPPFGED